MTEASTSKPTKTPAQSTGWHKHVKRAAVVTNILAVVVLLLSATLVFIYTKYT